MTAVESRTPRTAAHELLMPPHPYGVYPRSALCTCGDWQWDSDQQTLDYKAVLYDHRQHAIEAEAPDGAGGGPRPSRPRPGR